MGKESSSSKSRSSKPTKAHSSRHQSSSGRHRTQDTSSSSSGTPLSFLFAISDIGVRAYEIDTWGNARPPTSTEAYDQQNDLRTSILLYYDGIIEDVSHRYYWWRDDTGIGGIYVYTDPQFPPYQAPLYSQATICSGHPMLPYAMVKTDATVDDTQVLCDGDGMSELTWEPLRFFFPMDSENGRITGLSQAVFSCSLAGDDYGGAPRTHIAGRNASWLGSLVPSCYENPSSSAPTSKGLGGDLTILLGLMAFTASGREGAPRASTVFLGSHARWRNKRWHYNRTLSSYNRCASGLPQGLVVTVALDPDNLQGSTEDSIYRFETSDVAVRE